jgi:hypothetical protein
MKHARPDYDRIQDPAGLIPAEEPVFLIRGQDIAAPVAIRAWAAEAEVHGAEPNIIEAALSQADAIERWQGTDGADRWKVPDMPANGVVPLGTLRDSDGALRGTTGWVTSGRVWVTEPQIEPAEKHGWKRAEGEPARPFMGLNLYAVERA